MKRTIPLSLIILAFAISSCTSTGQSKAAQQNQLVGTWELVTATIIEKGDTTVTNYSEKGQKMIKIVNGTHFAFLNHDLKGGKDSATAAYVSGGGKYLLDGNRYTEQLEYCNYREWEGNKFEFTIELKNDTLIQSGIEKIEDLGVDRMNIEKYVRIKD